MLDQEYQKAGGSLESCRLPNPDSDHAFDVPLGWLRVAGMLLFFWKAYLPIENTLNGKRPRLVHRPRAGPM